MTEAFSSTREHWTQNHTGIKGRLTRWLQWGALTGSLGWNWCVLHLTCEAALKKPRDRLFFLQQKGYGVVAVGLNTRITFNYLQNIYVWGKSASAGSLTRKCFIFQVVFYVCSQISIYMSTTKFSLIKMLRCHQQRRWQKPNYPTTISPAS